MYNQYKKVKKARSRKTSIIKTKYIVIILIAVTIGISIGYAYWSTSLNITGTIIAQNEEEKLPIEIPPTSTDSSGENRYTVNTSMTAFGRDIYVVVKDEYDGNTITTTIQHVYKQGTTLFYPKPTFTLTIPNNTSSDFTNGTVELIDYSDANSIFQSYTYKVASQTISAGGTSDVTISGTLRGNQTVATNTYYTFRISYDVNGTKSYFYYKLIILPKS